MPLKSMLIPMRVPMAQAELEGQVRQIMKARMRVMMPSMTSQKDPWRGRT